MPRRASRWASNSPAGPAPTMPTWAREERGPRMLPPLERVRGDVAAHGHPPGLGKGIQVSRAAEPGPGARGQQAAEGSVGLVVDRLVVNVHDAGRDLPGQVEAAHDIAREDPEREAVVAVGGELG